MPSCFMGSVCCSSLKVRHEGGNVASRPVVSRGNPRLSMAPPRSPRSDAALLFVVLIWGLNFPIIKVALEPMPPYVVNAFRFAISALVLGAIHGWRTRHTPGAFFAPIREH